MMLQPATCKTVFRVSYDAHSFATLLPAPARSPFLIFWLLFHQGKSNKGKTLNKHADRIIHQRFEPLRLVKADGKSPQQHYQLNNGKPRAALA